MLENEQREKKHNLIQVIFIIRDIKFITIAYISFKILARARARVDGH